MTRLSCRESAVALAWRTFNAVMLVTVFARACPAAPQTFNTIGNGNWEGSGGSVTWAAVNPMPDHFFPIDGDTAIINSGHTVELNQNNATTGLTFNGGTILINSAALNVNGTSTWNSGTLLRGAAPGGTLNYSGGGFVLSGIDTKFLRVNFNNSGVVSHQGSGSLQLSANGTFTNLAGGVYIFAGDADIFAAGSGATAIFRNFGLVRKSAGTDVSAFNAGTSASVAFLNQGGTIQVDSGTLALPASSFGGGATFNVAAGATLTTASNSGGDFNGTLTGIGGGTVLLNGNNLIPSAGGTTINFNGPYLLMNARINATAAAPLFNVSSGSIHVGSVTLTGRFDNSSRVNVLTRLQLDGLITPMVVNNQTGGVFELQNAIIAGSGTVDFNNAGTFRKVGAGTSDLTDARRFNLNGGTLHVAAGSLLMSGQGNSVGGGTIIVDGGAFLRLSGTSGFQHDFNGTYTGSGAGTVLFASGVIGTTGGGATFNFPTGMLQMTAGSIRSTPAAPFNNIGTFAVNAGSTPGLVGVLNNFGRFTVGGNVGLNITGSGIANTTLNNATGGVFVLGGASANINGGVGSLTSTFVNTGTFIKNGGGQSNINNTDFFNDGGFVQVQSGSLNINRGTLGGGTYTADAGAVLNLQGFPVVTLNGTLHGSPVGTVGFISGTMNASGAGATLDFSGSGFNYQSILSVAALGGTNAAPITNIGTFTLSGQTSGDNRDIVGRFDNAGIVIHRDLGSLDINLGGSTFNNLAGALYDLRTDNVALTSVSGAGAAGVFNNAGTFLKSVGTLTGSGFNHINANVVFNNTGVVEVRQGILRFAGAPVQSSGSILTGGTWRVVGAATLDFVGGSSFTINQGTVVLSGAGSAFPKFGNFSTNQGRFEVAGGRVFTPVSPFSNPGTVVADGAGSAFTVAGTLVQQSGTTLTGGTWIARNGGAINLPGASLTINQGTVVLDGAAASFAKFNTVINNQGAIIYTGGRSATLNNFTNTGLLAVGPASTLTLGGATFGTATGQLQVDGTLHVLTQATTGDIFGSGVVNVGSNSTARHIRVGTLNLATNTTMTINAGGGAAGTSRVSAVSIAANARLDLNDHDLVLDYTTTSPVLAIRAQLTSGYAGGSWTGNGIRSAAAAATASAPIKTTLGYAEASALFSSFPATFSGQSIDNSTLLIAYTLYGDANLDRAVNITDFALLAANFNLATARWDRGDFNYDGTTNIGDFSLLAANFNQSLPIDLPRQSIPEPGAFAVLAVIPGALRRLRQCVTYRSASDRSDR